MVKVSVLEQGEQKVYYDFHEQSLSNLFLVRFLDHSFIREMNSSI